MDNALVWLVVRVVITAGVSVSVLAWAITRRRSDGTRRRPLVVAGTLGMIGAALSGLLLGVDPQGDGNRMMLALCLLATLAGVILAAVGARGRRVGDHLHCRACGFDLFGKPESSTRCSECGSDLDARRAVVVGVRRRILWLVFLGLFLLTSGTGVALPFARQLPWYAWHEDMRLKFYAFVPIEQVVDDFVGAPGNSMKGRLAARRVDRAMGDPALRPKVFRLLFDRLMINPQLGSSHPFLPSGLLWMSLETGSTDLSLLSDDEVRQLVRAGVTAYSDVPRRIAHGYPLYVNLYHTLLTVPRARIASTVRTTVAGQMVDSTTPLAWEPYSFFVDTRSIWPSISRGVVDLQIDADLTVELDCGGGRVVSETIRHARTFYVEVVDAQHVIPQMVPPTAKDLDVRWSAWVSEQPGRDPRVNFHASEQLSQRLTGWVALKTAEALIPIGFVEFAAPWDDMKVYIPTDQLPVGKFDLVFKPDPGAPTSRARIDLTPVLDLPFSVTVDPNQP
jgi:hypothetical protein